MEAYRCKLCEKIANLVHMCVDQHLVCEQCFGAGSSTPKSTAATPPPPPRLCPECGEELGELVANPLNKLIEEKSPCPHADCTWTFVASEMANHVLECCFRPYRCLGDTLKIWSCPWTGRQIDLAEHLATGHPELGAVLPHNAAERVPFDATKTMGTLNLVNAFSRRFVFFYYTDAATRMVSFVVFLLGKRSLAARYYVEFQLNYGSAELEQIEFTTACESDVADVHALIAAEKCIGLTHRAVQKYVTADGCLRFRLFIKERKAVDRQVSVGSVAGGSSNSESDEKQVKAKAAPVLAAGKAKKGAMAGNLTKKPLPSVANGGGSGSAAAPLQSRVPAAGSLSTFSAAQSTATPLSSGSAGMPMFSASVPAPPTTSATATGVEQPQHLTNAATLWGNCPKAGQPPIYRPQPYKVADEKFYTLKYPNTSIAKPVYKK